MREPVRIYYALMSGLQVLLAATAITDVLGLKTVGILLAASAAVQVSVGELTRSRVRPVE